MVASGLANEVNNDPADTKPSAVLLTELQPIRGPTFSRGCHGTLLPLSRVDDSWSLMRDVTTSDVIVHVT